MFLQKKRYFQCPFYNKCRLKWILETVPDEVAVNTGLVKRKRKLTGSALAQILVLGWLENPEASYQHLTETAAALGIQVSRQALEQRLTLETTEMLKLTLDAATTEMLEVAGRREALPLLQQFQGVYVQDSTWITLPDELHETWKGQPKKNHPHKAALKLHLCFDVLTGGFQDFQLTDGMTADATAAKAAAPLPEGSLRLADLAYFSLDELEKLTENGIYWVSRLKASYLDENGQRMDLEKMLKTAEEDIYIRRFRSVKERNVAQRLSSRDEQTQTTSDAGRNGRQKRLQKHSYGWMEPLYHLLTPKQLCVIVGIRWQIELMYKCFKSIGKLQSSRSQKPYRILSEIYAKLIALLIQHTVMLAAGWRCIQHSLMKMAKFITGYARCLTLSFHRSTTDLMDTLKTIRQTFEKGDSLQKSTGKNTTFRKLKEATENP